MRRKIRIRSGMCRLDADPNGKEVDQPGDVLSSSRCMLGRGVKRKLAEPEETVGEGSNPVPCLPYLQQRQLVLDLCLNKLQSCRSRAESSLHRSVLLANTLRQIQEEILQDGVHLSQEHLLPQDSSSSMDNSSVCPGSTENVLSSSSLSEESYNQALTADNRSSDLLFGSFEITNSTSYLTDLAYDDIFEDIDTSMYDSSDVSSVLAFPLSRISGVPLAVLRTASNHSPAAPQPVSCRLDLNDLDHIMEVLVGS